MTRPCLTLGLLMCKLQEVAFILTIDVFKIETIFTPSGRWSTVDFYTRYQCFGEAYCVNFRAVFLGYPQNPDDGSSMLLRNVCNYTPMSEVSCIPQAGNIHQHSSEKFKSSWRLFLWKLHVHALGLTHHK